MQPVRCPIRRNVTTVSPNRTYFHSAHRLPYILTFLYIGFCKNCFIGRAYNFIGNRRRLLINPYANPTQHRKRNYNNSRKSYPVFFHHLTYCLLIKLLLPLLRGLILIMHFIGHISKQSGIDENPLHSLHFERII